MERIPYSELRAFFDATTGHPGYYDPDCKARGQCATISLYIAQKEPHTWVPFRGTVNRISHWVLFNIKENKWLDLTSDQFGISIFYSEELPPCYKNFKQASTRDKNTLRRVNLFSLLVNQS